MSFSKGSKLFDKERERRQKSKQDSTDRIWNFYLDYEESKRPVVFLEDLSEVRSQRVHRIFHGNKMHMAACKASEGSCPLCDAAKRLNKNYAQVVAFFTVLDLKPFEKKDGTVIEATRKVLMATESTYSLLTREAEDEMEGGTIEGALFNVSRGPRKQPSPPAVGDQFRFKKYVDLADIDIPDEQKVPFTIDELSTLLIFDDDEIAELADTISPTSDASDEDDDDVEINI